MSRMKAVFAVLVMTATVAFVPYAHGAAKVVVAASGSSAMWQTVALAAFNNGACTTAAVKVTPPCFHYTSNGNFNLNDTRPTKVSKARGGPGVTAVDTGGIWIVWDSSAGPNVWAFIKVDSVVGNRCFWANPVCNIAAPSSGFLASGNKISTALWGADSTPPATVQALFTAAAGVKVNAAASDIRPEDGIWADCRVNSALGNGTPGFGDGLDGLGYNPNNNPGICAEYSTKKTALGQLVGTPVKSGLQGSSAFANVLAFNISGRDPFSNSAIPTTNVTISVGADPVTFVFERSGKEASGGLVGLQAATSTQLQDLFSGANCDAATLLGVGSSPNPIAAYLREPLSGTMNTTEANVFRRPVETNPSNAVIGVSQETGVGATNPLTYAAAPCAGGIGGRARGIGTSEAVTSVQNSFANNGVDGIGYAFFSFGNVNPIANSTSYGYITLDGVDPIFASYTGSEPGQPGGGVLPGAKNVCGGGGFPCAENAIWNNALGKISFPNLRNGSYPAWSLLRWVATKAASKSVTDLIDGSHVYVVNATPDYVPALGVPTGCSGSGCTDPGLQLFRAHYQQIDGDGNDLGGAPSDGTFNANGNPLSGDTGGDMGGCIGPTSAIPANGVIQIGPGTACSSGPVR